MELTFRKIPYSLWDFSYIEREIIGFASNEKK